MSGVVTVVSSLSRPIVARQKYGHQTTQCGDEVVSDKTSKIDIKTDIPLETAIVGYHNGI